MPDGAFRPSIAIVNMSGKRIKEVLITTIGKGVVQINVGHCTAVFIFIT